MKPLERKAKGTRKAGATARLKATLQPKPVPPFRDPSEQAVERRIHRVQASFDKEFIRRIWEDPQIQKFMTEFLRPTSEGKLKPGQSMSFIRPANVLDVTELAHLRQAAARLIRAGHDRKDLMQLMKAWPPPSGRKRGGPDARINKTVAVCLYLLQERHGVPKRDLLERCNRPTESDLFDSHWLDRRLAKGRAFLDKHDSEASRIAKRYVTPEALLKLLAATLG